MSFLEFKEEDIINTSILTYPSHVVELNGDQVTGSVYLEKKFLNDDLLTRRFEGFSALSGGIVQKDGPFTSSIDIIDAERGATNKQLYSSLSSSLFPYYSSLINTDYNLEYTGSLSTNLRAITVPEVYYDREILTGSLTASDLNSAGNERVLYDNGRGGIYSGSLSGTLVGNIFYSEGLVVLKKGDLTDFGSASSTNFKWKIEFKGTHTIPVKIFRCRAPAGQLNATSNPTYFQIPSGTIDVHRHEKEIVLDEPTTYITSIGLFNDDFDLVGLANLAQPIKKTEKDSLLFRVKIDF